MTCKEFRQIRVGYAQTSLAGFHVAEVPQSRMMRLRPGIDPSQMRSARHQSAASEQCAFPAPYGATRACSHCSPNQNSSRPPAPNRLRQAIVIEAPRQSIRNFSVGNRAASVSRAASNVGAASFRRTSNDVSICRRQVLLIRRSTRTFHRTADPCPRPHRGMAPSAWSRRSLEAPQRCANSRFNGSTAP